ncbi:MAG: hypothetical protein HY897_12525 [Deltaproteobacteria bacterium]|nr:hypothetical protein [Deltaproteobacteria bacterium]
MKRLVIGILCLAAPAYFLMACGSGDSATGGADTGGADKCADIKCSGHGKCALVDGEPACACDKGFFAQGLNCVAEGSAGDAGAGKDGGSGDKCDGVTCSGHGKCALLEGEPICVCDKGFEADGLECNSTLSDSGVFDTGTDDAGQGDAGMKDGGGQDAGTQDTGNPDAAGCKDGCLFAGQTACDGTDGYKECVPGGSGCLDWSVKKTCGQDATCTGNSCRCETGFGNCDDDWSNGCEADLISDADHCGTCLATCSANAICDAAQCACKDGFANCDGKWSNGCEVDTDNDEKNCGICRNECVVANGSPACYTGKCSISSCSPGFVDCDGSFSNGCETNTNLDIDNCGGCGKPCEPEHVANALCTSGTCRYDVCLEQFLDADGKVENGCERWGFFPKAFGGDKEDIAYDIEQTSDEGYVVAGYTTSVSAGGSDFWVLKLTPNGDVSWQKSYGEAGEDQANAVLQTTDGGYILAGRTSSYSGASLLAKLDQNGAIEWQKSYGGYDQAYSIQQTMDGGYVVSNGGLIKMKSSGEVEWQKNYNGAYVRSVRETVDGTGYFVAGWTSSSLLWAGKVKPTGDVIWQKATGAGWARQVVQTDDGGIVVGGNYYYQQRHNNYFPTVWVYVARISRFDDKGVLEWETTYEIPWGQNYFTGGGVQLYSIDKLSTGQYLAAGYAYHAAGDDWDAWVAVFDNLGEIVWQKTMGGPSTEITYQIRPTTISGVESGLVSAGATYSFGAGHYDFWVLKQDLQGLIGGSCAFHVDAFPPIRLASRTTATTTPTVTVQTVTPSVINTDLVVGNTAVVPEMQCTAP